jgi:hypothetical protein
VDIALIRGTSIKIRDKKTSIIVDPVLAGEADVVIATSSSCDPQKVKNYRVLISGPGEYEVGGVFIYGRRIKDSLVFEISNEEETVLFAPDYALSQLPRDTEGYSTLLIRVEKGVDEEILQIFSPARFVLFGNKEAAKLSNLETANKVSTERIKPAARVFLT